MSRLLNRVRWNCGPSPFMREICNQARDLVGFSLKMTRAMSRERRPATPVNHRPHNQHTFIFPPNNFMKLNSKYIRNFPHVLFRARPSALFPRVSTDFINIFLSFSLFIPIFFGGPFFGEAASGHISFFGDRPPSFL
jgi:hypothetical protein